MTKRDVASTSVSSFVPPYVRLVRIVALPSSVPGHALESETETSSATAAQPGRDRPGDPG
ncbi:MAG: hypothetical protein ACOYXS_00045 [Chloroflexota bacterium]